MDTWQRRAVPVPELYDSRPYAYEQCIVAGPLVFVAGQTAWDPEEGAPVGIEAQSRAVFRKVELALAAADAGLEHLVSMTVFLTDARLGHGFLKVRAEVLPEPYPASAMVTVAQLAIPEMLVEVQATAVRP